MNLGTENWKLESLFLVYVPPVCVLKSFSWFVVVHNYILCSWSRFLLSCRLLTHTCLVMYCEPWTCAGPVGILPRGGRLSEHQCNMFIKYLCCCYTSLNKIIYSEGWVSISALIKNPVTDMSGDKITSHSSAFEDTRDGPWDERLLDKLQFSSIYKARITNAGCELIFTTGRDGISCCGPYSSTW